MEKDFIVLDSYQQKALQAIHDLAENVFLGYAPGRGQEEEHELLLSFRWLVTEYIELIFKSSPALNDEIEELQKYKKQMEKLNTKTD